MHAKVDMKRKRKQAVQAVLDRNAQIIHALQGKYAGGRAVACATFRTQQRCEWLR